MGSDGAPDGSDNLTYLATVSTSRSISNGMDRTPMAPSLKAWLTASCES